MIGFFDSGFGGLTVLKEAVKLLPQYSYIYLGDNARTPYGNRDQETIYKFTAEGVKELFRRGAELVVLACNTSSSAALRRIQQELLPDYFPHKRVLGIIIPTAEEVGNFTSAKEIGVLATEVTVESMAYPKEIYKIKPALKVYQEPCPLLVPMIEAGETEWKGLDAIIERYLSRLFVQSSRIDTVLMGCTHYALIEEKIRKYLPPNVTLVNQGPIIANRLKKYLEEHPEIDKNLLKTGEQGFLTTEKSNRIESLTGLFYGQPIKMKTVAL